MVNNMSFMNMSFTTAVVCIVGIVSLSVVAVVTTNSYNKTKITNPESACYAYATGNAQFKMCADIYSKDSKKNDQ